MFDVWLGEEAAEPANPAPQAEGGRPDPSAAAQYNGATLALIDQLRRHHPPTAAHSVRVSRALMAMWARDPGRLGDPELVLMAGALHDIGKLFVPAATLGSGRRLDGAEFEAVRQHPSTGAGVLSSLGFPEEVAAAARGHHERWSGGGYPTGCLAETLSPLTRAVAVADAFVAMVEPGRAYRAPMTKAAALDEIAACSGSHFDPVAAETLIAAFADRSARLFGMGTL